MALPRDNSFDFKRHKKLKPEIQRRNSVDSEDYIMSMKSDTDSSNQDVDEDKEYLRTTLRGQYSKQESMD